MSLGLTVEYSLLKCEVCAGVGADATGSSKKRTGYLVLPLLDFLDTFMGGFLSGRLLPCVGLGSSRFAGSETGSCTGNGMEAPVIFCGAISTRAIRGVKESFLFTPASKAEVLLTEKMISLPKDFISTWF
jgi:hypothetical protein